MKQKHYSKAVWAPQAILDNNTCELLASVGPITTKDRLAQLIRSNWCRWDALSNELFDFLVHLEIPPLQLSATPTTAVSNKRPAATSASQAPTASKRPRTSTQPAASTTHANINFTPPPSLPLSQPPFQPYTPSTSRTQFTPSNFAPSLSFPHPFQSYTPPMSRTQFTPSNFAPSLSFPTPSRSHMSRNPALSTPMGLNTSFMAAPYPHYSTPMTTYLSPSAKPILAP